MLTARDVHVYSRLATHMVRNAWVHGRTPHEMRQGTDKYMVQNLSFPKVMLTHTLCACEGAAQCHMCALLLSADMLR